MAQDVSGCGVDVLFDVALFHLRARLAHAAFEGNPLVDLFEWIGRRKFHGPEVGIAIHEGDAVNVAARFAADLANETNFSFFGGTRKPKSQAFVRRKSISGDNSGAVAA